MTINPPGWRPGAVLVLIAVTLAPSLTGDDAVSMAEVAGPGPNGVEAVIRLGFRACEDSL